MWNDGATVSHFCQRPNSTKRKRFCSHRIVPGRRAVFFLAAATSVACAGRRVIAGEYGRTRRSRNAAEIKDAPVFAFDCRPHDDVL